MAFLALLITLALWQARGQAMPVLGWQALQGPGLWLNTHLKGAGWVFLVLLVLALAGLDVLLRAEAGWLWLPFASGVLLLSLGKGGYSDALAAYINACRSQNWAGAADVYAVMAGAPAAVAQDDWPALHGAFLSLACYKGFERLFAVLFWFAVLGPSAALGYRLCQVLAQQRGGQFSRLLWYLEWPAARALGFSFAFTGNFVGCWLRWRQYLGCVKSSTAFVIEQSVLGALSVDNATAPTCAVTRRELTAMQQLLERSLWFWLVVLAVLTLVY